MKEVVFSEFKENLDKYFNMAKSNADPILVKRKNGKNFVVISLDEYNNLIENAYIMSDSDYYQELVKRAEDI